MTTEANERQVGGDHYGLTDYQHWDFVLEYQIPYLEAVALKYLCRYAEKNGSVDLEKMVHYIEKLWQYHHVRPEATTTEGLYPPVPAPCEKICAMHALTEPNERVIAEVLCGWWVVADHDTRMGLLRRAHSAGEILADYVKRTETLADESSSNAQDIHSIEQAYLTGRCVCSHMASVCAHLPNNFTVRWECPVHGHVHRKAHCRMDSVPERMPEAEAIHERSPEEGDDATRDYVDQDGAESSVSGVVDGDPPHHPV